MSSTWLAQIGANPGGTAVFAAILMLLLLLLSAALLCFVLIGGLRLTGGSSVGPEIRLRWPKRWVRIKPAVIKHYEALSELERKAIFGVRAEVFLIEQGITEEPDQDGADPECEHVLLFAGRLMIGTARLQPVEAGTIKVGRVAVLKDWRGRGAGSWMMRRIQGRLDELGKPGVMNAQAYLEGWYSNLGWVREGETFTEAGLPHVRMRYRA